MLNDFTEKVNKITREITNKAHDTIDAAKLNSSINRAKQDIEEAYREIGKIYYENFALEENELFEEPVNRIRENELKVVFLQEQIHQLKGIKVCEVCEKELKQDMSFCPYCGNKMKEEPVEEAEQDAEEQDAEEELEVEDELKVKEEPGAFETETE
ncbi:MAG TPA: hypothetical protein GXX75_23220 [Clostridiales bacterium]|nr:hypothetical protein [Clostridiales bacterium]